VAIISKYQDPDLLACSIWQNNAASYHLVGVARIYPETDGNIDRLVKLGITSFQGKFDPLIETVYLDGINVL
jgi:hypothetical protein